MKWVSCLFIYLFTFFQNWKTEIFVWLIDLLITDQQQQFACLHTHKHPELCELCELCSHTCSWRIFPVILQSAVSIIPLPVPSSNPPPLPVVSVFCHLSINYFSIILPFFSLQCIFFKKKSYTNEFLQHTLWKQRKKK